MVDFNINELIGLFEKVAELDEKIECLKSQSKMVKADITARFKEFAKEKETKLKAVKDTYKYWKEAQESENTENGSDYFELISRIDYALELEASNKGESQ